jgi:hypothetical protein
MPTRPADPIKPKRKHSSAPKPFAGLTHKPHCALCAQETGEATPPPPVWPAPRPPTHRRPRTVDTSRHFCPHPECDYRGWLGLNNLRANGHPSGGPWRQFHCTACDGYFPEHHGTIFHGKQEAGGLIVHVLACLAEGLGIRATARVFEVDPNTVLHWLVEAAEQLRAFLRYFLCEVHAKQVQLDELYAGLRDLKAGASSEDEATKRLARSSYWVWTAMDPERYIAGGHRGRDADFGDGPARGASGRAGLSARMSAPVFDRWPEGLRHGMADALWLLAAPGATPRPRAEAETALDATP